MKRLSALVCLTACLLGTVACDISSVKNLSMSIRKGWKSLTDDKPVKDVTIPATKSELEAIARLEEVPGDPLSEEEKIRLVKAQAFIAACSKLSTDVGQDKKLVEMSFNLNKQYPPLGPIDPDELHHVFQDPMPEQIGAYRFIMKDILPQLNIAPDEPIPHGLFQLNQEYYNMVASHAGADMVYHNVFVIDRGNYGGWVRTAAWYHLRKGFINKLDREKYQFSGTTEEDGRTWVVWTQKGTQRKRFTTWWNDRFVVWVDGYESPNVVEEVLNTGWMDAVQ